MKTKMWTDPIVDEIHAIREKMAKESGYNLDVLVEKIRQREKEHPERLSTRKPMPLNKTIQEQE